MDPDSKSRIDPPSTSGMVKSTSVRVADKLLAAKLITKEKYEEAINHLKRRGGFIEESLIEVGAIDEDKLLKTLANIHRTQYVSTDKLRHADISPKVLKMVPAQLAIKHTIFPILFDPRSGELAIVNSDLADINIEQEVAQISKAPRIRSYVARPAAIKAAISKYYRGDIHAFANVDRAGTNALTGMLDVYERNLIDEESMTVSLAKETSHGDRMISFDEMEKGAAKAGASTLGAGGDINTVLEMMRVMISLIESAREDLAGHSVQTAQWAERMCRRIGISDLETYAIVMAALLHDVGKGSPYHLTAFNVAEWDGHRTAAEKRYENPERIFRSVNLPAETTKSLHGMYERFDGQGLPDGRKGKDISLGARIIAITDTFTDLIANPRNPFRRALGTEEAMKCLKKVKGKVFDPNLVDLFGIVVAGDDIKRQLLTGSQTVLLIDSDPEQVAILDLQLTSRGFKVRTTRNAEMALKMLSGENMPSLVLSEVDLEPFDGFKLKERLNAGERTAKIPFMFFTSRTASADVDKGFKLGAQDYLVKPSTADVVAAKISKYLEEKPGHTSEGVSGSLKEMSLPDLVQILAHGRKSGQLKLTIGQKRGEIHFVKGDIYNALYDNLRGQDAFFQMLHFKEGTFVLNPTFEAGSRVIEMTAEMLLLEGMRLLDEENR